MESNYVSETCKNECLGGLRIMSDNELLLAISEMMDVKLDARLKPIENRLQRIEVDLLENNVLPRLNTLEKFFWDFCDNYIEIVKHRLYRPEEFGDKARYSGQKTPMYCTLWTVFQKPAFGVVLYI